MLYSNCELGFWTWIGITSFSLNNVVTLCDSFPLWFEYSVLWVDKTFTLLLPKILLNEIKLHSEIPKTKFWSQTAFSNQNWDMMECPARNGSECTWSCTIYFQKIFLTSDDSPRKGNIKDGGKVTILLCNPRLGWGWGALKIFLRKKKKLNLFWMPC